MPDASAFLPGLGIVLLAIVLLWFAFGTQANVRAADRLMRWLQDGLPLLGPRATLRWMGSSVAELRIVEPERPCRSAALLIVLEPRDLSALWLLSRWRGRRDFLLLRLDLVRAPRFRADLIDPHAWTAGDRRSDEEPFARERTWSDGAGNAVRVRGDDEVDVERLHPFWDRLRQTSGGVWRVSVRPLVPHLEVHVLPPASEAARARQLLGVVRELAEAISTPR
jgi:hypothetical protein